MKDDRELNFICNYLASSLFPERSLPTPPKTLDWERLALLLTRHRLSAYFSVLGKNQHAQWPAAFQKSLKGNRYSLMFYGDQCAIHIQALLSGLNQMGIPVIVLKGWAYIPTIYGGDHSLRICEDIDILIRLRDIDRVEEFLEGLDFQLDMEGWPGYNRRYQNGARYYVGGQPNIPGSTFSIGLHWGLWHKPAYDHTLINIDALFERARPLQVATAPALELSLEDHIVYACAHHGLHHRFDNSLFRFYELAAVILKADSILDWELVIERAKKWNVLLLVEYVLSKIQTLWPGIIPAWVFESLRIIKPTPMELFTTRWITLTKGKPAFDHLLTWLTFPDWKQRLLIMLQDIFPSPKYMLHRYGQAPADLWPLLYFRRLFSAFNFLRK